MTLRSVASARRRPVLPDLPPTDDGVAPAPVEPTTGKAPAPKPAQPQRPTEASRPAVGGARLDSLLAELTGSAPQVAPERTNEPKAASSSSAAHDERSEGAAAPRARARIPWRFVLGIAGAAAMAAVALVGARGIGARLAAPGRTLDGANLPARPGTNYDAWMAAQHAAGERVM